MIQVQKSYPTLPAQNSANNTNYAEVIGNKTDTTAGDSIVGLIKVADAAVDAIQTDIGDPSASSDTLYAQVRHMNKLAIDGTTPPVANTLADTLHKDGSYTYDNTTDSLEAISDKVTVVDDYIDGAALELLTSAADGADVYPAAVANDSVIAKIISKGNPAATTSYNNTTDSLEMLSDKIGAYTGDGGADLDDSVKAALDLIEAQTDDIGAAGAGLTDITADTKVLYTTAIAGGKIPVANTLSDILHKDGSYTYDNTTDSLEAISDKITVVDDYIDGANLEKLTSAADGGGNAYPDAVVQESVIAYMLSKSANPVTTSYNNTTDSLEALADAIVDVYATTPRIVSRNAANTPQTTQTAYFTVTGRVLVTQIVGEVSTILEAGTNNFDLRANPTVGADVALCAVVDTDTDAAGTIYTITGTLADAMVATTSGAVKSQASAILVAAGTIDLKASASKTGQTKRTLHRIPLDTGSTVVVA